MSIVLTGDVHHAIGSGDQAFTTESETSLAVKYAQIAASYGVKVTLFFTGLAVVHDRHDAEALSGKSNVEIGGHGWDALRPLWWHALLNQLTGSPHGPPMLQRRMIRRTCTIIASCTGRRVRSWRNHAYRHDRHTSRLLAEAGITVWSDEVQPNQHTPRPDPHGVTILPINTLPDHEYLYHGLRTPQSIPLDERDQSYPPTVWCDLVCSQVERIVKAGGTATILVHPICMKVTDDFATFERLCAFLSKYPSRLASEATQ